ncbi:MAG: nucleotidyltransferase family protein [Acidobacteriota bacterium]
MTDFINTLPIPPSARDTVRAALRGDDAAWSEDAGGFALALQEHGVAPLVYSRLPHPSLRDIALRAAAAEMLRLEDLRALLAGFAERAIRVLIIKGSALAYDVYDAPELRPRADTDLLIDRADIERVRVLFAARGYRARVLSGDPHANRQQAFERADRFGVEHVYDVHWDIANTPVVRGALGMEELLMRAMPLPRIGPAALAPSHVDALLLACIHRVAHHHDSDRLIWLYDTHLLREQMSPAEHEAFWRRASERRVVVICERSIELADEWFARAPHDRAADWLDGVPDDEPSAAFLDRNRSLGAVLAGDLKALGWRARLERLRDLALPPAEFMRASFPGAPRYALPWLYLYRAARGVLRLFHRVDAGG